MVPRATLLFYPSVVADCSGIDLAPAVKPGVNRVSTNEVSPVQVVLFLPTSVVVVVVVVVVVLVVVLVVGGS